MKSKSIGLMIFSGILLGFAPLIWASDMKIVSPHDGLYPYKLVYDEKNGNASDVPGVYAADEQGNYQLLLKGDVLKKGSNPGVIHQLELSVRTKRHESLFVVDGSLYLVQQSNDEAFNAFHSVVEIGSKEFPVIDPLTRQEIDLPLIQNFEDIHVETKFEFSSNAPVQVLVVSIRDRSKKSREGVVSGITFSLVVEAKKSGEPWFSRKSNSAYLLDHEFVSPESLKRYFGLNSTYGNTIHKILSKRILSKYLSELDSPLSESLKKWKRVLIRAQEYLQMRSILEANDISVIPHIVAESGMVRMDAQLNTERRLSNQIAVRVNYDPVKRTHSLYLKAQSQTELEPWFKYEGRVGLFENPIGIHSEAILDSPSISNQSSLIALVDGSLIYFYFDQTAESKFRTIKLLDEQAIGSAIRKAEMHELRVPVGSFHLHERLLFVALKLDNGTEKTIFTRLKSEGIGLIADTQHILQYDAFISSKELEARVHAGTLYATPSVLFDERGTLGAGVAAFQRLGATNQPGINLRDPSFELQNQAYLENPIELHDDVWAVKFLDGDMEEYTSIVVLDHEKKIFFETSHVELLNKRKMNGDISPLLLNQAILDPDSGSKNADIFVVATGREDGNSFQLNFGLMDRETNFVNQRLADGYKGKMRVFESQTVVHKFEQLDRVVYLGPQGKRDSVIVFVSFKPLEGDPSSGGLYTYELNFVKEKSKGMKSIIQKSLVKQSSDYYEGAELLKRILIGKENEVLWIFSKETGLQDSLTRVRDLSKGDEFLLGGQKGRSLKPKPFSLGADSDFSSFDLSSAKSPNLWKKVSTTDVKKQVLANYKFKEEEDKENEPSQKFLQTFERTFPGFKERVENFADQSKPIEHRVLLVSDENKSEVMRYLAELLDRGNSKHWKLWDFDRDHNFFMFDSERASQEIVIENLQFLRERAKAEAGYLLIDALDTMKVKVPAIESEQSEDKLSFKLTLGDKDEAEVDPHLLYLLATEGQRVQLDQLKQTKLDPRIRILMVATTSEWSELRRSAEAEMQAGIDKLFKVDRSFYNLKWRVFPPSSPLSGEKIKSLESKPVTGLESRMLPSLITKLEDLADPSKGAEHIVMIVPSTIKGFVRTTALSTWIHADVKEKKSFWSQHRNNLRVYEFEGGDSSIDKVVKELDAMDPGEENHRSLLLVDGDKLKASFREDAKLQKQNAKYLIRDVGSPEEGVEADQYHPSVLYLLATEGKFVQPARLMERDPSKKRNSVLIFATQQEWDEAIRTNVFERRFAIEERFKILHLDSPTIAEKVKILDEIFESPSVRSLNLSIQLAAGVDASNTQVSSNELKNKLFQYLCNRVDTLSEQYKKEPTESFIKVVESMRQAVFSDPEIRKNRLLDRKAVERVLSKVMGIALNLHILPPDDPLSRLADEEKAAYQIQETGYSGSMELILKYIRTINSQTRASGGARVIPSSIILFGERGTGKTFLFKALSTMLNLKFYDVLAEDSSVNSEADAFFLNFESIRSDSDKNQDGLSDRLTAKEWVRHLQLFLLSPKGYRGFIFLDDVHKAVPKDRWEVLSFINQLHDAPNGFITLKDEDEVYREVFVGNLNLQMSLNPPDFDFFAGKHVVAGTENLIISRLKDKDCPFDQSVLARWSTIVNLSSFSVGAKGPALKTRMIKAAQQELNVGSQVVLTSTHAIKDISETFAEADARQFIDTSASDLLNVVRRDSQDENSRVKLLIPRKLIGQSSETSKINLGLRIPNAAGDRVSDHISDYVANNIVAISLGSKLENNNLFLLFHLLDSSRMQLYESLIRAVSSDLSFVKNSQHLLGPFLHALTSHIKQESYIHLNAIQIDPIDFGVTPGGAKYSSFIRFWESLIAANPKTPLDKGFFKSSLFGKRVYEQFTNYAVNRTSSRSRADVMTDTSHRLAQIVREYIASLYWVKSLKEIENPREWLEKLEFAEDRSQKMAAELVKTMVVEYRQFVEDFSFDQLDENQFMYESIKFPNPYDLSRLFFYALDKAIASQDWGKIVAKTVGMLETVALESELSQKREVQHYFFVSKQSIIHPSVHDRLTQLASVSDAYREKQGEKARDLELGFLKDCQNFFKQE